MQGNNKNIFDRLLSKTKIYLVIILVLLVFLCVQNQIWIIPSIIIYFLIVLYSYRFNSKREIELSETIQDLSLTADSAAKSSLVNSPFPMVIIDVNGQIIWKSARFTTEFEKVDMKTYLNTLAYDIQQEVIKTDGKSKKDIIRDLSIGNKTYRLLGRYAKIKRIGQDLHIKNQDKQLNYITTLYFIDETENAKIEKELEETKTCVGIIMVDNYDESMQQIENEDKPQIIASIDKVVYDWTNELSGALIKSDRDRYVYFFEQKYLPIIKEDKFSILDKIKKIDTKGKAQITLSISVSNEGTSDKEKYKSAESAMDVILGRGGDQAVIRENEIYKFFGGRAQEVEKRTKVKARVMAHALEDLIKETNKVIIMGHQTPDMDAIGSAMGIYRMSKELGKNAYIVKGENTESISTFLEELDKNTEYEDLLISKEVAEENVDNNTLIVVVDTCKLNYVEDPKLIKKAKKIAIIDHHRRSTDYIDNATISFQEVYASSAAELVTELLQYTNIPITLNPIEAESLYAGIMMDTKNFTFKTGVRTFEAAAFLRKNGVDIIRVKKWFQSNLENFNKIADIVKKAEIVKETIGIAIQKEASNDANLICAKAADELLTISDITASFVLGNTGDKICISGRSLGDINVQLILEKLGGGGHITLAGAQLENVTIDETKEMLLEKIEEYFNN